MSRRCMVPNSDDSDEYEGGKQSLLEVLTDFPNINQPPLLLLRCRCLLEKKSSSNGFILCNQCNHFRMARQQCRYDLALDHALSHMEGTIIPCTDCTPYTQSSMAAHLGNVHGPNNSGFDFSHIMDQHLQEIFMVIDQCFQEKTVTLRQFRQKRQFMVPGQATSSTSIYMDTYPIVLKYSNAPIENNGIDIIWHYLKTKLTNTSKPGSYIRCFICECYLGYLRNRADSIVSAAYVHMFTHTDIRPFLCNYCQHGVKSGNAMAEHVKSAHPEYAAHIWITNLFTNNTLQYKTELIELMNTCYVKPEPEEQSAMKSLREYCTRKILEYLEPGCGLGCSVCRVVLSDLWIEQPTTSTLVQSFDVETAFAHVLEHCRYLTYKCQYCSLIGRDYVFMKRHVRWIHKDNSSCGIHLMGKGMYNGMEKMINRCFGKNLNGGVRFEPIETLPIAKKRRFAETGFEPDNLGNGVSTIPSTSNFEPAVPSPIPVFSDNGQEMKCDLLIDTDLGSGMETAASTSTSMACENGSVSGFVTIKCEVIDSIPASTVADELIPKEPKKEESEFD